ncbi:crossover junction endodeoxyribonuclease RuvC [soil metagenome]
MIVLGVDPGTRHAGYGVVEIERGTSRVVVYGVLNLPTTEEHHDRIARLYDSIHRIAGEFGAQECAVETPFHGKNAQAMLKLGRAQAAVMLAASHRNLPIAQYAPAEIKKALTGRGGATKDQVWYMVRHMLSLEEDKGRDASDALAVALCHAGRSRNIPGDQTRGGWAKFLSANAGRIVGGT